MTYCTNHKQNIKYNKIEQFDALLWVTRAQPLADAILLAISVYYVPSTTLPANSLLQESSTRSIIHTPILPLRILYLISLHLFIRFWISTFLFWVNHLLAGKLHGLHVFGRTCISLAWNRPDFRLISLKRQFKVHPVSFMLNLINSGTFGFEIARDMSYYTP